jgi:hypothetical protein
MSADIAATAPFVEIDRDALGVDPALHLAATYAREVEAGTARVWENVFDWEHFPALHAGGRQRPDQHPTRLSRLWHLDFQPTKGRRARPWRYAR